METLQASEALVCGLFDWGKRLVEIAVAQPALFNERETERVAAQVELGCGPFRIVSLITAESVDALGIEPGMLMNAVVKATNVVVERAEVPARVAPHGDEVEAGA